MINLFSFAAADKSLYYLYTIFGAMGGIIAPPGQTLPSSTYNILGAMFKVFNSMILAIGALVILYVTVVGVVMTAHEGEFMGKKWNNIWIFIRIVFGIALMVPGATGYCAIQFIFMWIIVQGIGAADSVWSAALNYVTTFGSVYTKPTPPSVGTTQSLTGLFYALVCDATAKITTGDPTETKNGGYYCSSESNPNFCSGSLPQAVAGQQFVSFGPGGGSGQRGGACGAIQYCNTSTACSGTSSDTGPNSIGCLTCNAQITGLNQVIQTLAPIAAQFAAADLEYRTFFAQSGTNINTANWPNVGNYCASANPAIPSNQCCVPPKSKLALGLPQVCAKNSIFVAPNDDGSPQNTNDTVIQTIIWPFSMSNISTGDNTDFLGVAINGIYQTALTGAIAKWSTSPGNQAEMSKTLKKANDQGWITAGSFYYTIAQGNDTNFSDATPTLNYLDPTPDINSSSSNPLYGFRNNYKAAATIVNLSKGDTGTSNPQIAQATGIASNSTADVTTAFNENAGNTSDQGGSSASTTTQGSNPLARLQTWGRAMLIVAETTFVIFLAISLLTGILGDINGFVLGNGGFLPVLGGLMLVYMMLVPVMLGFLGLLVTYGGLLAVYAPLIPFVIWVAAVIGWFISVMEAMIAGPLVTLGMLSPSTQGHEILGKSEQALAHIFSIFLRPSLMVFGLIAGLLVGSVVVSLIDAGFSQVKGSLIAAKDPLGAILFYGAYLMLVVTSLNKSFALIYLIPQQVMHWMGLRHEGTGVEAESLLQGAKSGQQELGGAAAGGMKGASGAGSQFRENLVGDKNKSKGEKGAPMFTRSGSGISAAESTPPPPKKP